MTPSQHKTQAESLLTLTTDPGRVSPGDADFTVIAAHAVLAQAIGTGAHYASAEAALDLAAAALTAGPHVNYRNAARLAFAYAHLADR